MKEIIGKIKFLVIPVNYPTDMLQLMIDSNFTEMNTKNTRVLSSITEEQAAEFVRMMTFESDIIGGDQDCYENYLEDDCWYDTAKESLISLLKANGCLTKEMVRAGAYYHAHIFDEAGCTKQTDVTLRWEQNKDSVEDKKICFATPIEDYPDDFLIIKL